MRVCFVPSFKHHSSFTGAVNLSPFLALREVAEFLAGQTLSVDVETVTFAQHFPRRVPAVFLPSLCSVYSEADLLFLGNAVFVGLV